MINFQYQHKKPIYQVANRLSNTPPSSGSVTGLLENDDVNSGITVEEIRTIVARKLTGSTHVKIN